MNLKVAIDAGHGGRDPGAVNGIYEEADIALEIAKKLGKIIADGGDEVIYTRIDDTFIELHERCKIANNTGCDCFISIHLNASETKQANGTEILVYGPTSMNACELASIIDKKIVEATGFRDRGVKFRKDLYVLKHTKMPAILVEAGFISNDDEVKQLVDEYVQEKIAVAIYNGIKEWREESERT